MEKSTFILAITGESPSWYDKEDDLDGYTTNFGSMTVHHSTGEIDFACIGLGKNCGNTKMTVRIDGQEFQVSKDKPFGATGLSELNSPKYLYKNKDLPQLEVLEILEMLQMDDNYSLVAVIVKKALITSMIKYIKFSQEEKKSLKELFKIWRKPISVERIPVVY